MLLTITMTGEKTQELGYLLYKNPYRAQSFEMSFGKAYVFYPEISDAKTTAALLLDINPLDLARGKQGSKDGGLFDYVNDRPYVSSSFMSSAMVKVFGKAMSGICSKRQELADTPLDLSASVYMLPYRGAEELVREVFEPLGYAIEITKTELDEKFPEWGASPYIDLTISGKVRLSELLNHLYVLIPVFDKRKHYYISEDEIDKLLKHGQGWLAEHPARNKIVTRYFEARRSFAGKAINRLTEESAIEDEVKEEPIEVGEGTEKKTEKKQSLNQIRLEAVKNAVLESGASSVIDLGCGEGKLIALLLNENSIKRIAAADVSLTSLERAKQRLHYDRMLPYKKNKLTLMQASLTYKDERFSGYDAACVVEVMEHIDPQRIPAFERVLFEFAAPHTIILTTPNKEYNSHYEWLDEGTLRHSDHRFEFTREEFKSWAEHICKNFGYTAEIKEIGEADEITGSPTQMGVFIKCV